MPESLPQKPPKSHNLLRDAKIDRIQETLDDIKYWEIRNGGRK